MVSRSLGISVPEGEDVYEIYVVSKSRPSLLSEMSNLMGKNGIDILGVHGQVSDDKRVANIIFYVEMKDSRVKTSELLDLLKREELVTEASAEPRNDVHFEGMLFPLTSGGHYRVFVLGRDDWMELIKSFSTTFGSAASALLHREGVSIGEASVKRISDGFAKGHGKSVFDNLVALFRASGLGILGVSGGNERLEVSVQDPLISQSKEKVMDHFSVGIVTGALGKIYSYSFGVEDLRLEDDTIRFRLSPQKKQDRRAA